MVLLSDPCHDIQLLFLRVGRTKNQKPRSPLQVRRELKRVLVNFGLRSRKNPTCGVFTSSVRNSAICFLRFYLSSEDLRTILFKVFWTRLCFFGVLVRSLGSFITIWSVISKVLAKDSPFWNHACGESDTGSFVDTESIHPDSHLRVKYK